MYDEEDAEPRLRPPCLGEPPGPLHKIQRGTVQIQDHTFVPVQILDGPPRCAGSGRVFCSASRVDVECPATVLHVAHVPC